MCEFDNVISSILQIWVLHLYHMYLLHPGMYIPEAMICQHFYWPGIREAVLKEVMNCDTFQSTKWPNEKYGELTSKGDE